MTSISSQVIVEAETTYFVLTMHNEGKFNPDSLAAFNSALDEVDNNAAIQCLILTGEEKTFAQGLDLSYLTAAAPDESMAFVDSCMVMIARLLTSKIPVVSAVNGHAFGLGAMLVLASDYSVMREDRGYFCLPEIDLGMTLIPSMNALVKTKLSGNALRDLLLTGKRVGAGEAADMQVIDQATALDTLMPAAMSIANAMIGKDRNALSGLKRGLNEGILAFIH